MKRKFVGFAFPKYLLFPVEHLLSIGSGYASALECAFLRGDDNILSTYFQSQFPQVIKAQNPIK